MLLTILFQFMVSNARFERKIEEAQAVLRTQQRLRERLDSLFFSIQPPVKGSSFYTLQFPGEKELSLVALFDAGIDPDPAFSGPNTARLFIDSNRRLCFTQWPLEKEGHRTETLLEDVRAIEWEFLGTPTKEATPISPNWSWLKKWDRSTPGVPPIIRLKLWQGIDKKKQREPNLRIAFILPNQEPIRIIKES